MVLVSLKCPYFDGTKISFTQYNTTSLLQALTETEDEKFKNILWNLQDLKQFFFILPVIISVLTYPPDSNYMFPKCFYNIV